jgi:hypothetical protein
MRCSTRHQNPLLRAQVRLQQLPCGMASSRYSSFDSFLQKEKQEVEEGLQAGASAHTAYLLDHAVAQHLAAEQQLAACGLAMCRFSIRDGSYGTLESLFAADRAARQLQQLGAEVPPAAQAPQPSASRVGALWGRAVQLGRGLLVGKGQFVPRQLPLARQLLAEQGVSISSDAGVSQALRSGSIEGLFEYEYLPKMSRLSTPTGPTLIWVSDAAPRAPRMFGKACSGVGAGGDVQLISGCRRLNARSHTAAAGVQGTEVPDHSVRGLHAS